MPRYSVSAYTYLVPIAFGKLELRVRCPACQSVHAGIAHGGESLCVGCGQTLTVRGHELFVYVMPASDCPQDQDESLLPDDLPSQSGDQDRNDDKPDYPTFWYGEPPYQEE